VLGAIAAGGLLEPFDAVEQLDFSTIITTPNLCPAGMGDSMIEDFITEGCSNYATSTRTGSTEKWHHRCSKSRRTRHHFEALYRRGDRVTQASKPKYKPIEVAA